ncbi:MAG: hypothetical protein FWE80_06215, partial [Oscillospiraceae bacterium]|nr:hypothetical protein [Oscillospiraceae bacterium]
RRWIDFIDWYRQAMTGYAAFWMQTARKYFPDTAIYLCTGGDAVPWHASEFARQCKVCAEAGGGVRITNEASGYAFNFAITNWVASAGSHYGAYYSFEPAGQVTERGVVCRVYNAAATGAKSLHYYGGQVNGSDERVANFAACIEHFKPGTVDRPIALLYPDTPMMLDTARQPEMYAAFTVMRDYADYRYACDATITDGMLDDVKALVITMDGYYKTATLEKIRQFVENGGLLIGTKLRQLRDLDNDADYLPLLFADPERTLLLDAALTGQIVPTSTSSVFRVLPPTETERAAMQRDVCDPMTAFLTARGVPVPDGVLDEIFTAVRDGKLLVMNYSGGDQKRVFRLPDRSEREAVLKDLEIAEI